MSDKRVVPASPVSDSALSMPGNATLDRSTPEFDETTVPAGLLKDHKVAVGVWGRLLVLEGEIDFSFSDTPHATRTVVADSFQLIPPERPHQLSLRGPVRFVVEFYRC